jgi:aryl-alcohol dehydrogenase-like predicted oxidoreductase
MHESDTNRDRRLFLGAALAGAVAGSLGAQTGDGFAASGGDPQGRYAVQTMKPMGGGFLLQDKAITAAECLQYALSQPTSVVIHGIGKMEYLEEALKVVKNFQPMTTARIEALAERTKQAASSGKYEPYKTTAHFDSTAQHPNWLG